MKILKEWWSNLGWILFYWLALLAAPTICANDTSLKTNILACFVGVPILIIVFVLCGVYTGINYIIKVISE